MSADRIISNPSSSADLIRPDQLYSYTSSKFFHYRMKNLRKTCDMCWKDFAPSNNVIASGICFFDVTQLYDDTHPYLFNVSAI
ncbi:hypothetical protein ACH3XW_4225 [Acanthocheilonema viteae]